MKDRYPTNGASSELRNNREGYLYDMNHGRRSTDIGDAVLPWKVSRLVLLIGAVASFFLLAGGYIAREEAYKEVTNAHLARIEKKQDAADCINRMLLDVVVYKKNPEQPDCR